MKKIGMFGGTYDPIHTGHIKIAKEAMEELKLDSIFFIPTGKSYFKDHVLGAEIRLNMLKEALKDYPEFQISECEIHRTGNTYTIDTIKYFKEEYPDAKLYFIMGMDSFRLFHKWKNYEDILDLSSIVIAPRMEMPSANTHDGIIDNLDVSDEDYLNDMINKHPDADIINLDMDLINISSTDLRDKLKSGDYKDIKKYIPKETLEYIIKEGIYRER